MSQYNLTINWTKIASVGQTVVVQNIGANNVLVVASSNGLPTSNYGNTLVPSATWRAANLVADLYAKAVNGVSAIVSVVAISSSDSNSTDTGETVAGFTTLLQGDEVLSAINPLPIGVTYDGIGIAKDTTANNILNAIKSLPSISSSVLQDKTTNALYLCVSTSSLIGGFAVKFYDLYGNVANPLVSNLQVPNTVASSSQGSVAAVAISGVAPTGTIGSSYSFIPTIANGSGNKTFVLGGSLPSGLIFNTSNGAVTGTPTNSGTFSFSITVTDATGSASLNVAVTIASVVTPVSISGTAPTATLGMAFTFTPNVANGFGTKIYTVSGALPTGLTFNSTTGTIAGTPTSAGSFSLTIGVTDQSGSANLNISIVVSGSQISISGTPVLAVVGSSYSFVPSTSGGYGTKTFTLSGAVPNGLSLNSTTGTISGTPTQSGTFSFTLNVNDNTGSASLVINLTVVAKVSLSGSPQDGVLNSSFSFIPTASGGSGTKTFALNGTLASGLSFSSLTGAISGIPTSSGTFGPYTISVTDQSGTSSLTVNFSIYAVVAISGIFPNAINNVAYSFVPSVTNGHGTKTFALTGSLPNGLTFSTSDGSISGTPVNAQTVSGISISVSDSTGTATIAPQTLTVGAAVSISGTPATSFVGTTYSFTPTTIGGSGPKTFALTGSLPNGLTFNTSNGTISGTPTVAGASTLTLSVTDLSGTATLSIVITISASIAISGTPSLAIVGTPFSFQPVVTGGSGTKSFVITGNLPTGLTFNTSSGLISGTPTVSGTFSNVSVTVTDSSSSATLTNIAFNVAVALSITGTPGTAVVGATYSFSPTTTNGYGTKTYQIDNTLPAGLTFNTNTGTISGTPSLSTTYNGNIVATDNTGSVSLAVSLNVVNKVSLTGTPPIGTVNSAYSFTPTTQFGYGTKVYSLTGTLPSGLAFNSATGAITGTTTTSGTVNGFTVTVVDNSGTATLGPFSLNFSNTVAISGTPSLAIVGQAYTFTPTTYGGSGTKTFALTGTLPSGLVFDTTNGSISGTPTSSGTNSGLTISVSDSSGTASLSSLTISVVVRVAILGTPALAVTGTSYNFVPSVSNGSGNKSFSLVGSLPSGLSFDTTSGAITGTPTVAGSYTNLGITVTDASGSATLNNIAMSVVNPIAISGTPSTSIAINNAYSFVPTVSNGSGAKTFVISGSLPTGIIFDATTGSVSGTPTASGSFTNIKISVNDDSGSASLPVFTLNVTPKVGISGTPSVGQVNNVYNFVPTTTDGFGSKSFTLSGSLPSGLSFSSSNGSITGTPTTSTSTNISISVADSTGTATLGPVSFTINPAIPSQVTGLTLGTVAQTSVGLSWTANSGQSVSDYSLQYKLSSSTTYSTIDTQSASTMYVVNGLQSNTSYDFRVAAVNVSGTGAYSSVVTATTSSVPVLQAITLSNYGYAVGSAPGTLIGSIMGTTSGSTYNLTDNHSNGVAISGTNLVVGTSAPTSGSFDITITETLAGATGSPRSSTMTINVQPVLNTLTLSASSFSTSAAAGTVIGSIQGNTSGSTVTISDTHSNAVALSGNNVVVGSSQQTAGSFTITLTETLAGAVGNPKTSSVTITVTSSVGGPGTMAKHTDPKNAYLVAATFG